MKSFGTKFRTYKPFKIEHLAIPDVRINSEAKFLNRYGLQREKLTEVVPMEKTRIYKMRRRGEPRPLIVISKGRSFDKIKKELSKVVVGIAPGANVYKIPSSQPDLAKSIKNTLGEFNYYIVELGLNVMLGGQFKIPELLFQVDLKSDGQNKTDVTAYDIAPDDKIEHVKVLSGKISLGVNKLLKFIPSPIDKIVSDLIDVEINPWEFDWGFDKFMIDACGRKNYHLYWRIYRTNVVQGFNPYMILKVRKNVKNISASAKCIYKLKTSWWDITPDIKTNAQKIKIWPM